MTTPAPWITDRLPNYRDADPEQNVVVSTHIDNNPDNWALMHWSRAAQGNLPWFHTSRWVDHETPAPVIVTPEPEPEKATRGFTWFNRVDVNPGHEVEEYAVATDATAWWRIIGKDDCLEDKKWIQVRPLPQPGEE